MRVFAVIPHYFAHGAGLADDGRVHGSVAWGASVRTEALSSCIAALHQQFDPSQSVIDIATRVTKPVNTPMAASLDVAVFTTGDRHLLPSLDLGPGAFEHVPTNYPPLLLGFACRVALRERIGLYDYFCYLEDDLIVRDPWLFAKLAWFNEHLGDERLLQPNRYEVMPKGIVRKLYVDGDLADDVIARFVDVRPEPILRTRFLGREIHFRRAKNPHAGCYFLNSRQMATWASRADFLDHDASFIGPLESAATLGLIRTFKVYKPDLDSAAFLEIEHHGQGFIGQIRLPERGELETRRTPRSEDAGAAANPLPSEY